LGVLATANGLGLGIEQTVQGIERLQTVPGRFERVDGGQPFSVLVDYAHTDDALRNVLQAARGIVRSNPRGLRREATVIAANGRVWVGWQLNMPTWP
jgi:UDP-N-acetylmuramoyl-L-alanyl-D-glutamate--2,6-diaminopimelate ligase